MTTTTATKIQTRTWTGRNGTVRHYITNLGEVVGLDYDAPRRCSAWINEDGTWDFDGINNGSWTASIRAAVEAHQAAEQAAEQATEQATDAAEVAETAPVATATTTAVRTSGMPAPDSPSFNSWLTRMMDSEEGI